VQTRRKRSGRAVEDHVEHRRPILCVASLPRREVDVKWSVLLRCQTVCLIVYRASHSEPDGKLRTPGRAKWSVSWCSPDATAPRRKAAATGDHENPRNRKVAPACGVRAGGTACSVRRRQKVCPSVTACPSVAAHLSPEGLSLCHRPSVTRRSVPLSPPSVTALCHRSICHRPAKAGKPRGATGLPFCRPFCRPGLSFCRPSRGNRSVFLPARPSRGNRSVFLPAPRGATGLSFCRPCLFAGPCRPVFLPALESD
jgi:hypothetical protein